MVTIKLKKEHFSLCIIILCIFLMFKFPLAVKQGVNEGLSICFYTVIPSLFPFITLSTYMVKSNILFPVYKLFSIPVRILFKQPPCAVSIIIMSMIGGFPVGIKMTNDLYTNRQITKEQAERLCLFCMNAGPAFIISAVGTNMLKSQKAGIIIYISLCISSLISGIISSFIAEKDNDKTKINTQKPLQLPSISASITDSLHSILSICAWIVLFSAVTSCINIIGLPEAVYLCITSIFEVTNGCGLICGKIPLPFVTGLIGFGGICVHCQVLEFIKNIEMKYIVFFISRVLNGILSGIITYLILIFIPVETDVFSNSDIITSYSFSFSYSAFFVVIFMCIIMVFDIDRCKKYDKIN